jgi:flagellum-specific ATP synthase
MFDSMPKLLERSGTSDVGSITGFYTILVDGDDMDEPVADTVRGILDGHIVLSRRLAQAYHYPAIDVLQSISRLAPAVSGPSHNKAAASLRRSMAAYAEVEDLINVGAYHAGSNPAIDDAIAKHQPIEEFLIQAVDEASPLEATLAAMEAISGIPIPPEEAGDDPAAAPAGEHKRPKTPAAKIPLPAADAGYIQAQNSVAALFAGRGLQDADMPESDTPDSGTSGSDEDAKGDSGQ